MWQSCSIEVVDSIGFPIPNLQVLKKNQNKENEYVLEVIVFQQPLFCRGLGGIL